MSRLSRRLTATVDKLSLALNALRTSTAATDGVDARLSSWKNGKEENIRALLTNLDTVLWDEMVKSDRAAVKVGMHELVMPAQVKMRYMKVVARVHPDKARLVVFFFGLCFFVIFCLPLFLFLCKMMAVFFCLYFLCLPLMLNPSNSTLEQRMITRGVFGC